MTKVLVVDDDEDIRDLVRLTLTDEGYEVVEARNGREALRVMERECPDCILLDAIMPYLDGWQFANKLRARPGRATPVAILSASHRVRQIAAEVQADGYLAKPFALDDLDELVVRLLSAA